MAKDPLSLKPSDKGWHCSFCFMPQRKVKTLIATDKELAPGFRAAICDACIDMSIEILLERGWSSPALSKTREAALEALGLHPLFSRVEMSPRDGNCFYLGPFAEPFNTIYSDHVCGALSAVDMSVERADEIFSTDVVIEDVWRGINRATLIVADVTTKNPNVLYEVGIAHTVGKPVVLLTQDMNDVPFDLRHRRCIVYEYSPRGCQRLEEQLSATAKAVLDLGRGS